MAKREDNMSEIQNQAVSVQLTPDRGRVMQTGIGLAASTMARLDRLRACTGDGALGRSRSKVVEDALLSGGLDGLETVYAARVRRFNALARRAGQSPEEYALNYGETYSTRTYPPSVDALEAEEQASL
jgi:hypothetical protein